MKLVRLLENIYHAWYWIRWRKDSKSRDELVNTTKLLYTDRGNGKATSSLYSQDLIDRRPHNLAKIAPIEVWPPPFAVNVC